MIVGRELGAREAKVAVIRLVSDAVNKISVHRVHQIAASHHWH